MTGASTAMNIQRETQTVQDHHRQVLFEQT